MSQVYRLVTEKLYVAEQILDRFIRSLILQGPHPRLAVMVDQRTSQQPKPVSLSQNSLEELIGDGILWAVPKSRRSRERRLLRKFGSESGHKKMLPILKLLTCDDCGHVHEPGRLCPNCYAKNIEITEAMQEAMNSTQGLNPIEHEVLPVFKGENINTKDGFFQGKQVVEVARECPQWFSRRLTLKSNITTSSDTTTAKPTNLA